MKKYIYIKQKKREETKNSRANNQIIKLIQKTNFKSIIKYSIIKTLKKQKKLAKEINKKK